VEASSHFSLNPLFFTITETFPFSPATKTHTLLYTRITTNCRRPTSAEGAVTAGEHRHRKPSRELEQEVDFWAFSCIWFRVGLRFSGEGVCRGRLAIWSCAWLSTGGLGAALASWICGRLAGWRGLPARGGRGRSLSFFRYLSSLWCFLICSDFSSHFESLTEVSTPKLRFLGFWVFFVLFQFEAEIMQGKSI